MNVKIIDGMQLQSTLIFTSVITNIIFIAYLQLKMDLLSQYYNSGQLKSVDYSLMIKGLSQKTTIKDILTLL